MTTTIELADDDAQTLLAILDQNAQADSMGSAFYWDRDDIDDIEQLREEVAAALDGRREVEA